MSTETSDFGRLFQLIAVVNDPAAFAQRLDALSAATTRHDAAAADATSKLAELSAERARAESDLKAARDAHDKFLADSMEALDDEFARREEGRVLA